MQNEKLQCHHIYPFNIFTLPYILLEFAVFILGLVVEDFRFPDNYFLKDKKVLTFIHLQIHQYLELILVTYLTSLRYFFNTIPNVYM